MAEMRIRNHEYGVMAGLETNRARYGSGNRREDSDIICPCRYVDDDLAESGHCYCGLFVSGAFVERRGIIEPIPERRPEAIPEEPGLPAWTIRDLCSIKDVIRAVNELEQELKKAFNLTVNEGICLCCISKEGRSPGDCASTMGLSPSRISRILNSLEKKGMIERRRTAEDHRGTDLYLTKRGIGRLSDLRDTGFTFSRLDALPAPEGESPR